MRSACPRRINSSVARSCPSIRSAAEQFSVRSIERENPHGGGHCRTLHRNARRMRAQEAQGLIPVMSHAHGRQRREEYPAITTASHTRIADHDDPIIVFTADESSGALLQRQRRFRQLVIAERVATACREVLDPRAHQGIVRRGKRELLDDDQAQRFALYINAFPEARRAEQHSVAVGAKLLQQPLTRRPRPAPVTGTPGSLPSARAGAPRPAPARGGS